MVSALKGELTQLAGKKSGDAISIKTVVQKPSTPAAHSVSLKEQKLPSEVGVRYIYQPGELEGGRRRAIDPVWSLEVYWLGHSVVKPDEPVLYYLQDGPLRGFVREELLVVPPDTAAPRWGSQALMLCHAFVPVGQCVYPIFSYPALGVEW